MRRGLVLSLLIAGCPAPGPDPMVPTTQPPAPAPTPPVELPTVADPCDEELDRFEAEVYRPIVALQCVGCHQTHGPAAHTRLHLVVSSARSALASNWLALGRFATIDENGTSELLLRASAQHPRGHTGGALVRPGTPAYLALEGFGRDAIDPTCNSHDVGGACETPPYGAPMIRRMTAVEYQSSVADFLPTTSSVSLATGQAVTSLLADQLRLNAETIARGAAQRLTDIVSCAPTTVDDEACRDEFIARVGDRLYRRPLTTAERLRYAALFDATADGAFEEGARWIITAMLQSPNFFYRSELGHREGAVNKLSGHEIATALAFFVTGRPPDEILRSAAIGGALVRADERERQTRRLLDTPAGREHAARFFLQWLDLDRIRTVPKDSAIYPIDASIRDAMHRETRRFITDAFVQGDTRLRTFLTASHSFVTPKLARLYGEEPLSPVDDEGLVRVDSPLRRHGLLTQGSLLTVHARANDGSPIHRGKLVRERMLCSPLPSPPAGLQVEPPSTDPNLPMRERYAAHAAVEPCRSCHRLIDPIGFGFNAYDGIGRFRTEDAGAPVDSSGEIVDSLATDATFDDLGELASLLAESPDVQSCFAEKMQSWAYGAEAITGLECALVDANVAFASEDFSVEALIVALARADHLAIRTSTTP